MARKIIQDLVKKTVSFIRYKLFGPILQDEAQVQGTTESAVIEQHIINDIYPENSEARFIITTCLYPENDEEAADTIGDTLTALFRENAAGTAWGSKHDNFKPLVEYSRQLLTISKGSFLTGKEEIIYHMRSQLDSVVQLLKEKSEKSTDTLENQNYQAGFQYATELYKRLSEHPNDFDVLNLFTLVLDYWDDLKAWTRTYRLLGDAASVSQWPNNPQYKLQLLYLIKDVSAEWSDDTVVIPDKMSTAKSMSELKQKKKEELLKFIRSISSQDLNYIVSIANDNMLLIGKNSYVDYDAVVKEIESW